MRKRLIYIAGIVILIALAAAVLLQYAADADEMARLRRHSPYGHHFINTALTGGKVEWDSKDIRIWYVRRRSRELKTLEEFKEAFLRESPDKQAMISIHHSALKLDTKEGSESHERAEAIHVFLIDNGTRIEAHTPEGTYSLPLDVVHRNPREPLPGWLADRFDLDQWAGLDGRDAEVVWMR